MASLMVGKEPPVRFSNYQVALVTEHRTTQALVTFLIAGRSTYPPTLILSLLNKPLTMNCECRIHG